MTITLNLPPETEAAVMREAEARELPVPDYLLTLIQERRPALPEGMETYLLSESALAKDWLRPEEDEAWQHL